MGGFAEALQSQRHLLLEGLPPAGLAYLTAQLPGRLVVLTADDDRAERLAADLQGFGSDDVLYLAADDALPFEDVAPDPQAAASRLALRQRLQAGPVPHVVVASAAAVQGRWMPAADFAAASATYAVDQEVDRDALARVLVRCGYQAVNFVEDEGTFAIRGGVVDVFVPQSKLPQRIDLFGDEIASIKTFSPESQRTFDSQTSLTIFPIREVIYTDENVRRAQAWLRDLGERVAIPTRRLRALSDEIGQQRYFYGVEALWPIFYGDSEALLPALVGAETTLVLEDGAAVEAVWRKRWLRAESERDKAKEHHQPVVAVDCHLTPTDQLLGFGAQSLRVESVPLALSNDLAPYPHALRDCRELAAELSARRTDVSRGEILDPLLAVLDRRIRAGDRVFFACNTRGHAERLRELLLARKVDVPLWERGALVQWLAGRGPQAALGVAPLGASLDDPKAGVLLVSDVDIFATAPKRLARSRKRAQTPGLSSLRDLQENDPVIHQDHGIGRYLGLKRLILNGVDGDYVHLEYADGDKLYVPVYHLNVLQRYSGPTAHVKLDKLGGTRWLRAKQRVKDAVLAIAHELLALQAARRARPGYRMPKPDAHFRAFEAAFPHEETPDQQKAIDDVLADLQKDTPMDRLVCGDVGYGKTEVAIRATYLAVLGKRQVAVLVPTTVLAEQHRATFAERLQAEGVVVEVLSRFRSAKETGDILKRLRAGAVDVVIGTHRLLSADVAFHDLGLLVVDEEQRFGVKNKERIKQMRSQVHVLTLSATPIPRTLHMASVGLRDLSIIQTPPVERSAIRTEVLRFDETVMAEAIQRELHRGGQVFVVHNRVQSIEAMAHLVQRLVPTAAVGIAHGQMTADQLERIMVDFVRRTYNVLVCTAIIESGIDIPSANTMIVNRADAFGLAQLYQLRGRIGRGRDRAYAYLMLPRSDKIGQDATARLAVLKRFSELGAGFMIASHDLELRGAGDLLGADQSGSIAAVGFELYTELLAEAVERARGQKTQEHEVQEPEIKLPVAAVLPESYVPEPMQRLAFYQRMAQAPSDAAIFDVVAEVREVYGPAPDEVEALAEVMVLRRRLRALGAVGLSANSDKGVVKIGVTFAPSAPVDREDLVKRCQKERDRYRLLPSGRLAITVPGPDVAQVGPFLQAVRREIGALQRVGGEPAA